MSLTRDKEDELVRALVVDDERLTRKLYQLYFRKLKWLEFEFAENGAIALEKIKGTSVPSFNVIITDINMPEMDGIELLRRIGEDKSSRILPIVVTAYWGEYQEGIKEVGFYRILPKPIDFELLVLAIKRGLVQYDLLNRDNGESLRSS
ncbi:MAG: response regulator [Hormoscilla sp.]